MSKIQTTAELVGHVLEAAGQNDEIQAAGSELAKSAHTITKTINNVLLPLAAINYAFDRARAYFADQFSEDLASKLAHVPADAIQEPPAIIAGPALQGLAFSHSENSLRELYLQLLASSMDSRKGELSHPAFVEVIKQLSAFEASELCVLLRSKAKHAIVSLRLKLVDNKGFREAHRHVLNLISESGDPVVYSQYPAMIDNWVRLGLVEVDYYKSFTDSSAYNWVEDRPELLELRERAKPQGMSVDIAKGVVGRTEFGARFAAVVGIDNSPLSKASRVP